MVQVQPALRGGIQWHKEVPAGGGEPPPSNLGKQFEDFKGGPAEAEGRWKAERDPGALTRRAPAGTGKQGQLFDPQSTPLLEPHHQTPEQFAKDPRTWWHGRVTKGGPTLGGSSVGKGEGFHAGTFGAAESRVRTNIRSRGLARGYAGRMYPLRITGAVDPPEQSQPDMPKHYMLGPSTYRYGESVGGRNRGYLYRNEVEGGGQLSVGVPKRKGFMSTHKEMVTEAKKSGEYVHPSIEWAAKKAPPHTGQEMLESHTYARTSAAGHKQLRLDEQFGSMDRGLGGMPRPAATQAYKELHPETSNMERTSYQTEAGGTQHVHRWRDPTPGAGLLGKQWERGEYKSPPQSYES